MLLTCITDELLTFVPDDDVPVDDDCVDVSVDGTTDIIGNEIESPTPFVATTRNS